jgi:hypothetical protein
VVNQKNGGFMGRESLAELIGELVQENEPFSCHCQGYGGDRRFYFAF